jgi:hypothetical protein
MKNMKSGRSFCFDKYGILPVSLPDTLAALTSTVVINEITTGPNIYLECSLDNGRI